jgi:hypothetical protein
MPLQYLSDAKTRPDLVRAGVHEVLGRRGPLSGQGIAVDQVQVERPHDVYDLRAETVAAGGGLDTAEKTGQRYLVHAGAELIAAGEVVPGNGGEQILANLNYGVFVPATAEAIGDLEAMDVVSNHQFEVRLLRCASVYVMAVWLKSKKGRKDIIYPLSPAPPPIEAAHPYSPDEFMDLIRPLAKRRADEAAAPTVP